MNKSSLWILSLVIVVCVVILSWLFGFGLGGCASTQQVTATTTTSTSTTASSTTTSTIALTWSGSKQFGTPGADGGAALLTNAAGNIYVAGLASGTLEGATWQGEGGTFGEPGPFLAKFDSAGNIKWIRQTGSSGIASPLSAARDSDGNIYVAGTTDGTFTNCTNAGGEDVFLLKYDSNGTIQWVKQYGTSSDEDGPWVAVDSNKNVYLTGNTTGNFDNNPNQGSQDFFLVKVNPTNGNILWSQQFGTTGLDIVHGIITDSARNIYLTGSVPLALPNNTQIGLTDTFLMQCSPADGHMVWATQFGSGLLDIGKGLAVDSHDYIYIAGNTPGGMGGHSNQGSLDFYLAKFDPNSHSVPLWINLYGTTDFDDCSAVAVDSADHVYLSGNTRGAFNGYTNAGSAPDADDAFLIKTDSDGNPVWTRQFGTDKKDFADCVVTDLHDNVYVSGITLGGLDGNTNTGDNGDIYLIKFDPAGNKQ